MAGIAIPRDVASAISANQAEIAGAGPYIITRKWAGRYQKCPPISHKQPMMEADFSTDE